MGNYKEPEDEAPIIESTATVVEQGADPATGEIREEPQQQGYQPSPPPTPAVGGGMIAPPASRAGDMINLLEDGQLSMEMQQELSNLADQIRMVAERTGTKAKGELTLKLLVSCESDGEALSIIADVKAKAPQLPRRRSIMWQDDDGSFLTHPPRQKPMFGQAVSIRRVG